MPVQVGFFSLLPTPGQRSPALAACRVLSLVFVTIYDFPHVRSSRRPRFPVPAVHPPLVNDVSYVIPPTLVLHWYSYRRGDGPPLPQPSARPRWRGFAPSSTGYFQRIAILLVLLSTRPIT